MTSDDRKPLEPDELAAMDAELLPRREAMSVLGPVPAAAVEGAIESAVEVVPEPDESDSSSSET
jgi:hypothetical protein